MCKGKFLAYIGSDDEDDEVEDTPEPPGSEVVTADLSHVLSMDGSPRTSALIFQGFFGKEEVSILVDTGSTHNFIHPRVVEKLKLPLTHVRPFRVYVGNGESIVCDNVVNNAELRVQGHSWPPDCFESDTTRSPACLGKQGSRDYAAPR